MSVWRNAPPQLRSAHAALSPMVRAGRHVFLHRQPRPPGLVAPGRRDCRASGGLRRGGGAPTLRNDRDLRAANHLHCIWTLPEGDADFSGRWRRIKTGFSRRLPRESDPVPGRRAGERGIWQRRFWEHVITDADDLAAHIEYVHANPVKHRLVADIDDWPFSSWHRWRRSNLPGEVPG